MNNIPVAIIKDRIPENTEYLFLFEKYSPLWFSGTISPIIDVHAGDATAPISDDNVTKSNKKNNPLEIKNTGIRIMGSHKSLATKVEIKLIFFLFPVFSTNTAAGSCITVQNISGMDAS